MLNAFFNMWRVPDLRNRILFTLAMLVIYRLGFFVPLMGVNQEKLASFASKSDSAAGNLIQFVSTFTGGTLSQSTIFGLGIAPYISASIIFQLLATVLPSLKAIQKEGPAGRQKIQEWTRYATVGLCLIQASVWLKFLQSSDSNLVYVEFLGSPMFWICGVAALTAGTCFLMWIGEQIDRYGIGNGVSLLITAGIVSHKPQAILDLINGFSLSGEASKQYTPTTIIFLIVAFIVVVAGSILITQGQRRIQIQQQMHTRGRRVVGGHKSYLPLRVNHGGVMPIIFASSLMLFPSMFFSWMRNNFGGGFWEFLDSNFRHDGYLHVVAYIGMIYFFAYFWTTVQFQPKEMATELQRHGSFIQGLRPGPRTAEYLELVMERITYVGAGFLAIIAVIPTVVSGAFNIPFSISNFLGGTGLLIVVSVMLDLIQRIEANLMMRNHQGFLGGGAGGKGPKIRGSRNM